MNIRNSIKAFFKGFTYAFKGIFYCIRTQRNMRFHIGAAFYVILFMFKFFEPSKADMSAVFLCIGGVIALECINTAIENLCDYACKGEINKLIKTAKDTAAGGVLVMAIISVFVGISIFGDIDSINKIFGYYSSHITELVILIISIIIWLWLTFTTYKKDKD